MSDVDQPNTAREKVMQEHKKPGDVDHWGHLGRQRPQPAFPEGAEGLKADREDTDHVQHIPLVATLPLSNDHIPDLLFFKLLFICLSTGK